MDIYNFIIQNREVFKIFYALIIILISAIIVIKAHRLYHLSLHSGLRYFRNAFLFFGLAFASRYLLKFLFDISYFYEFGFISIYLFEFFLITGGFFLIYSLLWKRFEGTEAKHSSLFNLITSIFYILALILALIDFIWGSIYLLFISQIIIFFYASIISYSKFIKDYGKHAFPKFYFLAMIIALVAWILNFLVATVFDWNMVVTINIYILNSLFFLLFLYGIIRVLRG